MRTVKLVALGIVAVIAVGILCGCAPAFGRIGQMFESIREEVREEARQEGAKYRDRWEETTAEQFGTMMDTAYGEKAWGGNALQEYEPYGISYDEVNEGTWFNGKPLAGMRDKGHNTITSSAYANIGAYVIVERDETDSIVKVYETDQETFKSVSGIDGFADPKKSAEEMGSSFYKENKNIKGLDQAAFTKLENELRMKYKNEDASVECNDYVFKFYRGDLLPISSFCRMDRTALEVKAFVDYNSTPAGFDLNLFDSGKTDGIIMKILSESGDKEDDELEQALVKAIAQAYGVDEKYILIEFRR